MNEKSQENSTWLSNSAARLALRLIAVTFMCLLASSLAEAATFTIANGNVSALIAAINTANSNGQADIINLAPGGTYSLTSVNNPGNGLPIITSRIILSGNGATIERSGAVGTPDFRILQVSTPTGFLTLDGVTIRGGRGFDGGGLFNEAILVLTNSTVTANNGHEGGGIYNYCGRLTVWNSTVSWNTGYGGRTGGGILNLSLPQCISTVSIDSSTIFENRADGDQGFRGRGDAIADAFSPPGRITLRNSVIASPTRGLRDDCNSVNATSFGHNIASDSSCHLTGPGDLNNTNPLLGSLAINGGTTWTHLPLPGSPAINAVPIANCTFVDDQRGVLRPQAAACDIGSVEAASNSITCVQRPSGMVAWWSGDGNAKDIQGPTFDNGTQVNGATFGLGKVGQAFLFDGIDDYVDVGNPTNLNFGTGDFSIDAWIRTSFIGGAGRKLIVSKTSNGPDVQYALGYQASTDGKLFFLTQSSPGVFTEALSSSSIADGQFHHVAGVRRGRVLELYIDGNLVASSNPRPIVSASSANSVVIGGRQWTTNDPFFKGVIDEVEIFKRALGASEIQAIFRADTAGKCKL
jgi:hypothetical protein